MVVESRDELIEPILREDAVPTAPTADERWAEWREEGARQDARSGRIMRLIAFFAALALAIGFIWASLPPR